MTPRRPPLPQGGLAQPSFYRIRCVNAEGIATDLGVMAQSEGLVSSSLSKMAGVEISRF